MKFLTKDLKNKMFLVFFAVLTWWSFTNYKLIGSKGSILLNAASPLLIGLVIAFILNRPMMFLERNLFKKVDLKSKLNKYKRPICLLLTLLAFLVVISLVLLIVIPSLVETGVELKERFPEYLTVVKEYIEKNSDKYALVNEWTKGINVDQIKDSASNFLKGGFFNLLGSTFSAATSVFGRMLSFFLGLIFSIYFLLEKETLVAGIKKLIYAALPLEVAKRTLYIGDLTKKSFSEFLVGQSLEAVILGSMFFVTMVLFRFPYSTMISIVIAVFSFVPIVGSFVGLFVGVILIFVESPKLAGLFIILFLVLQQIEGNLIYPKVVGKFSGLSPLFTMAAVTLGGSLMGVFGIILFIPAFAVIQELLKEFVETRTDLSQQKDSM